MALNPMYVLFCVFIPKISSNVSVVQKEIFNLDFGDYKLTSSVRKAKHRVYWNCNVSCESQSLQI